MRDKLRTMLGKHPFLYNILYLIKYRNDTDFMEEIQGLKSNSNLIELKESGIEPKERVEEKFWCNIVIDGRDNGFFAMVRWTLDAFYFCECFGLNPFVEFSDSSLYHDEDMPSGKSVYEYYFEQPFLADRQTVESARGVVIYDPRNRLKAESLNGGISYQVTEEYITQMAEIMKKYLKFNKETQRIISEQLSKRKVNENVLGVHIRGTDYKSNYKNHPQYISPEDYYVYIDKAMEEYGFEKIYIATDDNSILNEFLKRYSTNKVIYADEVVRSDGTYGVHTASGIKRPYHKYKLGLEVICDMCTLAACGGLVSSLSQVGLVSRIYKKSCGKNFLYDKKIDKGINKKGRLFNASI